MPPTHSSNRLRKEASVNPVDRAHVTLGAIAVMLTAVTSSCTSDSGNGTHDRDGREHRGEAGEESGTELALNETYDAVRNGVRLILAYDAQSSSFNGTVENTTNATLKRVRVEVHLSNGKELGPTTPADLAPGKKRDVKLSATSRDFDGWTAHPEVGSGEHGHGEGHGEHGREGRGEHRKK